MNLNINKNEPVMVTGATGFVASELIKKLLENGLTVHAAVRNPKDVIKVQHLTNLESGLSGKIIFFTPVSSFTITEALPVSDPVPAVVGIAIIGEILLSSALFQ